MLAVPQHHAAHVAHAAAVHEHTPGGDGAVDLAGLAGELEDGADFADVNVPGVHAHGLCQLGMELQMPLLAVDGDEEFGLYQPVDDFQLLLAGVAGDVKSLALFIHHVRTLAVQLVDDVADGLFVAGNGGGGNNDPVAGSDVHLLVGAERHPVQGGHILTLRAGGDNDNLILGQALDGS